MLYNFLHSADLDGSIKEEMLEQLTRGNEVVIILSESSAVSWMKDYLGQRFDVASIFPVIGEWTQGNEYGPARPITLGAASLYGYDYPANDSMSVIGYFERPNEAPAGTSYTPPFEYNTAGRLTNYVWHQGSYYEAVATSLGIEPGNDEDFPDWAASWRLRDPRDPKVVSFAVDITLFNLFKRVAPRKLPELRVSLYNQAKEWLELVRDGNLTPDLPRPVKADESSDAIRWGSNRAQDHYY
jgi:hypothetical protein